MIVGYAGANAGFTANLMVAGTDSLLQGLTNEAIKGFLGNQDFAVDVTCNWYFMVASTFLVCPRDWVALPKNCRTPFWDL